jgi:hypothetical protein
MYSTQNECLIFFSLQIVTENHSFRYILASRTPDARREADCSRNWMCSRVCAVKRVCTCAQENGYTDTPNTPKLMCTCLQLVLVNVPKNLGAISGRSSSSLEILQMAGQVTLRHYRFPLTYRPETFDIMKAFKLQKAILNNIQNTGCEYY